MLPRVAVYACAKTPVSSYLRSLGLPDTLSLVRMIWKVSSDAVLDFPAKTQPMSRAKGLGCSRGLQGLGLPGLEVLGLYCCRGLRPWEC